MSFTSVSFLVFLALSVIVYFTLPGPKTRAAWLLSISVGFYLLMSPRGAWVLTFVTLFTYGIARAIGRVRRDGRGSRPLLTVGVLAVAGTLVAFKYLGFFADSANALLDLTQFEASVPVVRLLLPIGVSFWTFQTIAYLVDVYRGTTEPERNLLYYATSVVFFPIVTAGPITRVQTLVPQLSEKHRFDYTRMRSALLLMGRGFFKKLLIADRLAVFANTVFDHPRRYAGTEEGLIFLVAASFFAIQLYCDFSGYTDIVRGASRLFGVELPLNFRAPYFARSVGDFWRRWHISLMDWLRDYVYIPLGGNRKGRIRRDLNLMAVFLVSGLWHGAGWNFIVWGGLNGLYRVAGEKTAPLRDRFLERAGIDRDSFAHKLWQTVLTFLLITVAWVFFRASSLSDAVYMVERMFVPTVWIFTDGTMVKQGLTYSELVLALASLAVVGVTDWLSLTTDLPARFFKQPGPFRWMVYLGLIAVIVVFGHYGGAYSAADFVYFKF